MKTLLLAGALLLALPSLAQNAIPEAPSMLADVQDEIASAHLKPLKKTPVSLRAAAVRKQDAFVTLQAEGLSIRASVAELAKARSVSAKVQQKYDRAIKYLRTVLKEGHPTIELNQPATRDLEHLLAAWALPKGNVAAISWHDQPITAYTVETYGGGSNQALYPEGQVFYFYAGDRTAGFYEYMNVPKQK